MNKSRKSNYNDNKKWILLGVFLIAITAIVSLAVVKFSNRNVEIEGVSQNISSGSQAKVYMRQLKTNDLINIFSTGFTLANGTKLSRPVYYLFETRDSNGKANGYVYCMEVGNLANVSKNGTLRNTSTDSSYWKKLTDDQRKTMERILVYGYPNNNRDLSVEFGNLTYEGEYEYMVTQLMIWEVQNGWRTSTKRTNSVLYDTYISKNKILKSVYNALETELFNHDKVPSFAKTTKASAPSVSLSYNASTGKYTYTLTDSNKVLTNFKITCPTGLVCTKSGNKLSVESAKAISAQTISFQRVLPSKTSQGKLVLDNGSDQRMILGVPTLAAVNGYVNISTEELGSIVIKKTSEDNIKAGFEFKVTGPNNYSQTFKTDSEGNIKITNLKLGEYKITEVNTPDRYVATSSQSITLSSSAKNGTKSFYNELKNTSSLKVLKVDQDGNPIAGAKLYISTGNANVLGTVESWTSTTSAYVVKKTLDVGKTYYLCESQAPAGYVTNTCQSFSIASKSEAKTIKYENKQTEIKIVKVDENGKALKGAVLQVLDSSGKEIDKWVSDGADHSIKGLAYGSTYTLRELEVPDGYVKAGDQRFTPSALNTKITMKNTKNEIVISKKSGKDGKLVGGAVLKLLDNDGNEIESWTTEDGKTKTFTGLAAGKYTLVEEKAPNGYSKAENLTFTVNDTKKTLNITMTDEPTEVVFSKISVTGGKEIGGAHLQVIDSEGNVVEEWVSVEGQSHTIVGKLIEGDTYILKETQAPDGYVIAEEVSFTVGANDKVVMENKLTEVKIYKRDTVSGKNVAGAHLQLLDPEGNVVREWDTTDREETITGLSSGVEYTILETVVPENYLKATDMKFTLSSTESSKEVVMLDTPIVYVENTASNASIAAVVAGIVLVLGGAGTVIWLKKKEI